MPTEEELLSQMNQVNRSHQCPMWRVVCGGHPSGVLLACVGHSSLVKSCFQALPAVTSGQM